MRTAGFFAGALCVFSVALQAEPFSCAGQAVASSGAVAQSLVAQDELLPAKGQVHALVVFAQFADETPGPVPDFADCLSDPHLPGSFARFYHTMSFGQLQVKGTALSRRYPSDQPASAYLSQVSGEQGRYGTFALEILRQVDADIDFGLFDNDGPDGVPNSGDDDGVVDYVFINVPSAPSGFILGEATGIAGLGFEAECLSADSAPGGHPIRLSGVLGHGAIQQEGAFPQTVGSMATSSATAWACPTCTISPTEDQRTTAPASANGA